MKQKVVKYTANKVVSLQPLSGITLPLTLAPAWLKTVADFNPPKSGTRFSNFLIF